MANSIPYIRRSLPVPSKKVPAPVRAGNQSAQGSPLPKWSLPLGGFPNAVVRSGMDTLERAPSPR